MSCRYAVAAQQASEPLLKLVLGELPMTKVRRRDPR